MLLNNKSFYWHQLDAIAFEFEYWKIWHFPTLLTWKHLLSWRLCYASISSRHVWRPQRDTVSVLPFSSKGSPSLTTCTPELKKLAGTCKFANEQLNVNLCIVLFVDCVHNMPSRNSCRETLHSKKPSCRRFSKRSKGHSKRWKVRSARWRQEAVPPLWSHKNHTQDYCRYKVKCHRTGHLQSECPNGKPSLKVWKERQRVSLSLIRRAWSTRFRMDSKNFFSPSNGQFVVQWDNGLKEGYTQIFKPERNVQRCNS